MSQAVPAGADGQVVPAGADGQASFDQKLTFNNRVPGTGAGCFLHMPKDS